MATTTKDAPDRPRRSMRSAAAFAAAAALGLGLGAVVYVVAIDRGETNATPVETAADQTTLPAVDHAEPVEGAVPEGRSPDVPDLPFADNPDPSLCGIPLPWNGPEQAWLSGVYDGELIQSEVLLYNSHLRLDITASAPHGTEVKVLLHQANPVLDYYLVDLPDQAPAWIPEPFLSFEPVESL